MHLGVICTSERNRLNTLAWLSDLPADFWIEGDSFLSWGDSPAGGGHPGDHTIHIVVEVDTGSPAEIVAHRAVIEAAFPLQVARLADYVVVTDNIDWGEDVWLWTIDNTMSRLA
jgi:hypothetical protein